MYDIIFIRKYKAKWGDELKNFKLKQGNNRVYQISKSVYDEATQKRPLYYDMENDKCYAICPQCDNPIQLIGLYKQIKVSPYGKHYPHSIPLAAYNQQAYERYLQDVATCKFTTNYSIEFRKELELLTEDVIQG